MFRPTTTRQRNLMSLRVVITAQTAAVFATPITAGVMLSSAGGRALHSASSYTLFVVVLIHLVAAFLAWRPGGGSAGPVLSAAGFLGLTLAQVVLGIAHVTTMHLPLGVLLFGISAVQLVWVWTVRRSHVVATT